ncbi:GNAT family N-acetyltransferase [Demequina flava]|uniref:GNAT family N-acetyltransferase n=1 Tax=Demequina flava TaxID=1095025 RepID=UPI0009E2949E|nr:GNAT family N-acetyltransferase [Demequina flava]
MSHHIAAVKPDDATRLTEIGQLTALAYLSDGLVDQAHPYIPQLKDAKARAEVAELLMMTDGSDGSGAVIGTITVVPPGSELAELGTDDAYELRMLAVSPLERGRGIGAELTKAAMERVKEHGGKSIVLSTMESMNIAHRLYERMGFERRPDLDWTVIDNDDGTVRKVMGGEPVGDAEAGVAIRLLGYSWEASSE